MAYADDGETLEPLTVAPIQVTLDGLAGLDLEEVRRVLQRQVDEGRDRE